MQIVSAFPSSSMADDFLQKKKCVLNVRSEVLRETKYASKWEKIKPRLERMYEEIVSDCRYQQYDFKE